MQSKPSLKNLGPATWRMLRAANIADEAALRQAGALAAYLAVRSHGPCSLNLLWSLEGALSNRHWQEVAREERTRLLIQLDDTRRQSMNALTRCGWCSDDPLYIAYHDDEWGKPVRNDDQKLFEMLILEGAQAGLSWITILRKRENYRRAFHGFDPVKVAAMNGTDIERLLQDSGIVRNRLKVNSAIRNARVFLVMQQKHGSFSRWLWDHVNDEPIINHWDTLQNCPSSTELSDLISKKLKKEGMNFVGSTIIYAFLQATGVVNDHLSHCPQHPKHR